MIVISPSFLSCDFLSLKDELDALNNIPNLWYHLDVMDGHFVPNLTFGHPIIKKISSCAKHPLDVHLMVSNPAFYIHSMKDYHIHNITIHLESTDNPAALISEAKKHYKSVGLSIKPKTPLSSLSELLLNQIDLLLVMSVDPGFSGQSFLPETYSKLEELLTLKKKSKHSFVVQVDGGVSDKNAHELIKRGVTNLVTGSYLFKNDKQQYSPVIDKLRKL